MEEVKLKALVTKALDYGENDKLLQLVCAEKGKFTAVLKGVKKAGAKLKFAGEPFCFGEFYIVFGARNIVVNCDPIENFFNLRKNLHSFYHAAVALEVVSMLTYENQPNVQLLLAALKRLAALDEGNCDFASTLKFLIDALKNAGYKLDFDACSVCGSSNMPNTFLDKNSGSFVCGACVGVTGSEVVSPSVLKTLSLINFFNYDQLSRIKLTDQLRMQCAKTLGDCFKINVGNINSLQQLV